MSHVKCYVKKAPSKDYISRLFLEAFLHREESKLPDRVLTSISEQLDIEQPASEQVRFLIISLNKYSFNKYHLLAVERNGQSN